jgi:hypothetical protein
VYRLEVRPCIGVMRNQSPPQPAFHGKPSLWMAAEYKLHLSCTAGFIAELSHVAHPLGRLPGHVRSLFHRATISKVA